MTVASCSAGATSLKPRDGSRNRDRIAKPRRRFRRTSSSRAAERPRGVNVSSSVLARPRSIRRPRGCRATSAKRHDRAVGEVAFPRAGGEIGLGADPYLRLQLALEATSTSRTAEAEVALRRSLTSPLRSVLAGHEGAVLSVALSNDGKLLATAGDDRTAQIWRLADGKNLAVLRGHEAESGTLHSARMRRSCSPRASTAPRGSGKRGAASSLSFFAPTRGSCAAPVQP